MIRTILGRRGYGKTTLGVRFLSGRAKPTICVTFDDDMMDQFPEASRYTSSGDLLDDLRSNGGLDLIRPLCLSIYEPEEFNLLCRTAIAHRDLCLIVDEVDMFDSTHLRDPDFLKIIHYGRHDHGGHIDLVTTSRRPARISRDLRSQTDEWYLFKMTDSRDLDFVREDLGEELPDRVRALEKFQYIRFDHEGQAAVGSVSPPATS